MLQATGKSKQTEGQKLLYGKGTRNSVLEFWAKF